MGVQIFSCCTTWFLAVSRLGRILLSDSHLDLTRVAVSRLVRFHKSSELMCSRVIYDRAWHVVLDFPDLHLSGTAGVSFGMHSWLFSFQGYSFEHLLNLAVQLVYRCTSFDFKGVYSGSVPHSGIPMLCLWVRKPELGRLGLPVYSSSPWLLPCWCSGSVLVPNSGGH